MTSTATAPGDERTLSPAEYDSWAAEVRRLAASATPSCSRTTTSSPRSRTSPTTSATRSRCRASRRGPTPARSSSAACTSWPRRRRSSARTRPCWCPTAEAGCSLADTIDADQLRAWKAEHPGAVVVAYVNTTRRGEGRGRHLLHVVQRRRGRRVDPAGHARCCSCPTSSSARTSSGRPAATTSQVWLGECHVHAGISPTDVRTQVAAHPDAELLVHPECGCATSALWLAPARATCRWAAPGSCPPAAWSRRARDMTAAHRAGRHRDRHAAPAAQGQLAHDASCR